MWISRNSKETFSIDSDFKFKDSDYEGSFYEASKLGNYESFLNS
jgi:hypothetical protein